LWNKDNMLEQAYRVLRSGGYFIILTPNLASWASRLLLLAGKTPLYYGVSLRYDLHRPSYGHISLYTYELLMLHLRAVGFNPLFAKGLLTAWCRKNVLIYLLTLLASTRPHLAPDILVVAYKP